jgi:hypothetical protein
MHRKRLMLAGVIGRYPVGGVTWCALHYLAGLQRLGYDVFYLEDTGECAFDPVANGLSTDPSYSTRYIRRHLAMVGLENAWTYVDYTGRYHGHPREAVIAACREADAMINLSGGCWIARPEYEGLRKVFIDTDPGFTQRAIVETRDAWYKDFFGGHHALFTFALNIGAPGCTIPETPLQWQTTVQPVVLDFWPVVPPPADAPYTTILSWRVERIGMSDSKGPEILRLADVPARSRQRIVLAIAGQAPIDVLNAKGWATTDAVAASIDAATYRTFIQHSRAEIGFAKSMYVQTRSGWFSDRTECYLASGRPAVARDTGFGDHIPCGEGLFAFTGQDDLLAAMADIESDYQRHSERARMIAAEFFSADKVLRSLLERAGLGID